MKAGFIRADAIIKRESGIASYSPNNSRSTNINVFIGFDNNIQLSSIFLTNSKNEIIGFNLTNSLISQITQNFPLVPSENYSVNATRVDGVVLSTGPLNVFPKIQSYSPSDTFKEGILLQVSSKS
jgi:hypothetical protein